MKAVSDFNYKVDLAEGLKHLKAGKLRVAEDRFRRLVTRFPKADGGYRGLARVQMELGDRAAALATLRDGASLLAKSGDRAVAIDMLHEATQLDPLDLSAHRRLSAALALAGDVSGAADEYVRFADAEIEAGDPERARLEASYAIETLGEIPKLHDLAQKVGLQLRTVRRLPRIMDEAGSAQGPRVEDAAPRPEIPTWGPELDPRLAFMPPAEEHDRSAEQERIQGREATEMAQERSQGREATQRADPFELEKRANELMAARDPGAGRAAVEAAAALREAGKLDAASDLLLQLVALGIDVHDAERELIAVAHALGRTDIAEERARLLTQASRLG